MTPLAPPAVIRVSHLTLSYFKYNTYSSPLISSGNNSGATLPNFSNNINGLNIVPAFVSAAAFRPPTALAMHHGLNHD